MENLPATGKSHWRFFEAGKRLGRFTIAEVAQELNLTLHTTTPPVKDLVGAGIFVPVKKRLKSNALPQQYRVSESHLNIANTKDLDRVFWVARGLPEFAGQEVDILEYWTA